MRADFERELVAALPVLRRYAISRCRLPDMTDDLVQIAVERAVAARDRFDPATRPQPWLFRLLRNGWFDAGRRQATRGTEIDVHDLPEAAVHDGVRAAEAALMLRQTEAALATLPNEQREVFELVCFEELSYAETAEVPGIPRGTVMSRLARGRVALAAKLGIK